MKIKKHIIQVMLTIGLMLTLMINAYAQTENEDLENIAENIEVASEFIDDSSASISGQARGMLISSVEVSLTNKGLGVAELSGTILCHNAMKKIRMMLYLEKWDDEYEDWEQVNRQEFAWLAEDYPDNDLTMAVVSYKVPFLTDGIYRVRAIFGANSFDGRSEASMAYTPGIDF